MPNEVYAVTHTALSALVSHRAATRVLDVAMEATGTDPDRVTVRAMRRLLAGRVRRELSATLPSPGLTLSLKRIADDLYRLQPSHDTIVESLPEPAGFGDDRPEPPAPVAPPTNSFATRPGALRGAEPSALESLEPAAPEPTNAPTAPGHAAAQAPAAPSHGAPSAVNDDALDVEVELDERVMMLALQLFGELETVEQVVIVRGGEVLLERGAGAPTGSLPNLVKSTQHLLARAGRLKLFALERAEGMLFVFPVGTGAVVVLTQPNVNIGAVLAARAALEEAA